MSHKRGQGEGSIGKRQDGLWIAQVSIQGRRHSKYFKTQREGLDWLQYMRAQIQAGLTSVGAQMSLANYLDQWLGSIRASVRPHTLEQYQHIVKDHIVPSLGKIRLQDLKPGPIQALYNAKLNAGTGARTVQIIHSVLHRSLKQALRWGIIARNPVDGVNRPKVRRKEMQTLTDTQVRSLLLAAKGTRYEAFFWMAVSTGLRQGELLGLKWSDLDWVNRRLHVQRQLQWADKQFVFTEPKSAAGRRVVVLGQALIEKLCTHMSIQDEERREAADRWQENNLIFPSSIGTPWEKRNVYKYYQRFLEQAGLPKLRFHDLRHTAATLMLQQGVNPKVVQERLGHADITLTLNTYSHVLPAMQEEAASKLDELLTPVDVSDEIKGVKDQRAVYLISPIDTGESRREIPDV